MSDDRNPRDRNRFRDDDERFGRMNERDARHRAAYGERDAYGEWDREAYGRTGSETGYGRERAGSERSYGPDAPRERGRPSFSGAPSFGGAHDDRFGRGDGYRDARAGYGSDRYGRRDGFGGERPPYGDDVARERYRRAAHERGYGSDADRGEDRGFLERAGDEIASWFGDHDAERRREADRRFGGRGPKGYTRSDERIHDDINDRLTDDHYIDASDVEVSVREREVTLSGHVPTRDQKRRAEDLAERVSGVTHVQNNLRVGTGTGGTTAHGSTGDVASPGGIGGPRGWSTDTAAKTDS